MQDPPATLVIAIDGPSGSGKSTVAQRVAAALGLRYLDTGAMYRALTWLVLERDVLDDEAAIAALASQLRLHLTTEPAPTRVQVEGVDVTAAIREPRVTTAVSRVAALPAVRAAMLERQRGLIGPGGIVVEGRDIGTAVVPAAAVKVFLTADAGERARRRAAETSSATSATLTDLARRDALDSSRAASPLARAEDAVVVDSTDLGIDAVVDRVVALASAAVGGAAR